MTYNFDYISSELRGIIEPATFQSHRFEKRLGYKMFDNACVAPYYSWDESIGCVIGDNGIVVKDSECLEWKENGNCYDFDKVVVEKKNVIYLGFLLTVFGHSFTDNLRKLWFLNTNKCKELVENGWEMVYTTSWNRSLPVFVLEIFRLAGYDISGARHITETIKFDKVCVPDNSFISSDFGRLYSNAYAESIKNIESNIPVDKVFGDKIYFSRSKFSMGKKKEYGERSIERVFKKEGYAIVYPEEYSIIEQLQMVRQCKSFASTEGSVAHLSLFCMPGTQVTIINKANYLNFHQVMINEFASLNVTYIEAHHSVKVDQDHPWWGPFYLCVNRHLEHFVGHRVLHLPYWLLPSYWEYSRNVLYRCFNRIRKLLK